MKRRRGARPDLAGLLALAALAASLAAAPFSADAQVFLATKPAPAFTVGPLFLRGDVSPALGPVTVDVLWSLVLAPGVGPETAAQDLYLLWPTAVTGAAGGGADPELARYVEARGFAVIDEGRLPLFAESVRQAGGDASRETLAGGAPFVTFVLQGGPLGLSAPASYIRIPWTPKLVSRAWLVALRVTVRDLIAPKTAGWMERVFWGQRHLLSLGFNDVRSRGVFPLYLEHRDRVVRLADEPSQILVNFAGADRLKIDEVSPPSSSRRRSESLENTEVVSHFLDPSEGIAPQVLTVQFAYFSGLQGWGPILIPTLFFVLGNLAAVLVRTVAERVGKVLATRVRFGAPGKGEARFDTGVVLSRDTLARITPGVTTYADVLDLCGRNAEHLEKLASPERRTLVYRGRRAVPQGRRMFRWLTTVREWDVEQHTVEIDLAHDIVTDVKAVVRRAHRSATSPPEAPGSPELP